MVDAGRLQFERDGAQCFEGALDANALARITEQTAHLPQDVPGVRLAGGVVTALEAADLIAGGVLGPGARPVRAVLFDKTAAANWPLGWHQDRTIVVAQRREVEGFGPWSMKGGLQHVEPPFRFLQAMVTLRLHLDDVDEDNAPLLIAPGSHRLGRLPVEAVDEVVLRSTVVPCHARAGDIWLYATPILHASAPAARPRRRRVLQIDYAAGDLPGGLEWLGI